MSLSRGALIVIEGCDRSGKTTQCAQLVSSLLKAGIPTNLQKFPDRTTSIGETINSFLQGNTKLDDRVIHLLYSANRWEFFSRMKEQLLAGTTLVVDRYVYSGVAFSGAKQGMNVKWCCQPDVGLLRPDVVLFFDLNPSVAAARHGYGDEVYEKLDFQTKVYDVYKVLSKLDTDIWKNLDAGCSVDVLHQKVMDTVLPIVEGVKHKPLDLLWSESAHLDKISMDSAHLDKISADSAHLNETKNSTTQ
jgi:dTMP kinase